MSSEYVHIPSVEESAQHLREFHRLICAHLKAAVKESAAAIHKHNQTTGKARDGYWLSQKQQMKVVARARHLVYGFVRGHDLDRMESPKSKPVQKWQLQHEWNAALKAVTNGYTPTYGLVKKHVG